MKNQTKITMILLIISIMSVCIAGCTSESPQAQNESLNQSNISVLEPTLPVATELPVVVVAVVTEVPAPVVAALDTTNATVPV
jgi:hypothetical protein